METTAELPLRLPGPDVTPADVDRLCRFLAGRTWTKASEIEAILGLGDREIRLLAEYSDGRILSGPGCPGYRLFDGAAACSDADAAATRLESQAKRMLSRAAAIRRRFHRYGRAAV